MIATGSVRDNLYYLKTCKKPTVPHKAMAADPSLWHARLAHVNQNGIRKPASANVVDGLQMHATAAADYTCKSSCVNGKQTRDPIPKSVGARSTHMLDLVHSDVETMPVESLGGSRYFVTFINDHSRYCWTYTMKSKSDVFSKLKLWHAMVCNPSGRSTKAFRTNRVGEYMSQEFTSFLDKKGIFHDTTISHNPWQNGVAERLNCTLVDLVCSMLHHKGLEKHFWAEALAVAVYVRNRVTSKPLPPNVTTFELWTGKKPDVSNLRVFGCICFYRLQKNDIDKRDARASEAIFNMCQKDTNYGMSKKEK